MVRKELMDYFRDLSEETRLNIDNIDFESIDDADMFGLLARINRVNTRAKILSAQKEVSDEC